MNNGSDVVKALSKKKLIKLIQDNFQDDEIILKEDALLKVIWEQFGDDYFI